METLTVNLRTERINFLDIVLQEHALDMIDMFSEIYSTNDIGASRIDYESLKFQLFHRRGLIDLPLKELINNEPLKERLDTYIKEILGSVFSHGLKHKWIRKIEWDNAGRTFTLNYVLE